MSYQLERELARSSEGSGGIYGDGESIRASLFRTPFQNHSMGAALGKYVEGRVSAPILDRASTEGLRVDVEGIFSAHARSLLPGLELLRPNPSAVPEKWGNWLRPSYAIDRSGAERRIVVLVQPGLDYVQHNAELIDEHLALSGTQIGDVRYYPGAEQSMPIWTDFASFEIDEVVVVGYAEQIGVRLLRRSRVISDRRNEFYRVLRLEFPSQRQVTFLSVRFSFWGSMARVLAKSIVEGGARHVIYAGKLGTLDPDELLYDRPYVPDSYHSLAPGGALVPISVPENPLLDWRPSLGSGAHLSVKTMMRETRSLVTRARAEGVRTIDNEISQFAMGVADSELGGAFSAIHFATDAPLGIAESSNQQMNLTTTRRPAERAARDGMFAHVARLLDEFFSRKRL